MSKFRIQSHGRLQEWVAEENGYFRDEGLDYEFIVKPIITWSATTPTVASPPTRRWIDSWDLFPPEQKGSAGYDLAVI
ncbi:MAG TPA: hypothetical protein VNO43_17405 [Candidatus Eisenbacteria bacterium]|nr:hypothetical protein [Candidatus Eisenbacteria bacterium]